MRIYYLPTGNYKIDKKFYSFFNFKEVLFMNKKSEKQKGQNGLGSINAFESLNEVEDSNESSVRMVDGETLSLNEDKDSLN